MQRISKKIFLLAAGDLAFFYAALFSGLRMRYGAMDDRFTLSNNGLPFAVVFIGWLMLFSAYGLYDLRLLKNSKIFLYRLIRAMVMNTGLAIIIFYLLPLEIEPRRNLFITAALATFYVFCWRYAFNLFIIRAPSLGVLFAGTSKEMVELASFLLRHPQLGHRPVGFIKHNEQGEGIAGLPRFALERNDIVHIVRICKADIIVIAPEMKQDRALTKGLIGAIPLGVSIAEFPAFHEMLTGKIPLSLIQEAWFLENLIGIKKRSYEFLKRIFDVMLAACLLAITAFLHPFIALAIKFDSEGTVFFRQRRLGRYGKEFQIIKYRSMIKNADRMSGYKHSDNGGPDLRLTRVGAFLRKNYLDEFPQAINILRGEMSFIGPRPERQEYAKKLTRITPFYEMRLLVPPGLTGWAQINMENDASVEDAPEKMQYDLYYIKNRSFVLDLLIALRTLFTLIQRQGR